MAEVSRSVRRSYVEVADELCADIRAGKYSSSHSFPSLTRIMRRFGVTRVTAMRIVDELKRRGVITAVPRSGILVKNVNRTIGLIVPGIAYSEFFPPIVSEISRLAQKEGYTLLFGDVSSRSAEQRACAAKRLAKGFALQNVAGVLYQPIELVDDAERANREILSIFGRANAPVVILDSDFVPAPRRGCYDVVGIDNHSAGMLAATHLLALGVRRIGFLKRPKCSASVNDRLRGVVSAIFSRLGDVDKRLVLESEPTDVNAVRRYLRRYKPQAVICGNDTAAVDLMRSFGKLGLKVPDDIMLVGFDDVKCASIVTPRLTTVRQPCAQIAKTAFYSLLRRIENPDLPPKTISLPVELIVRESTLNLSSTDKTGEQK